MDREAWSAAAHGAAERWTDLVTEYREYRARVDIFFFPFSGHLKHSLPTAGSQQLRWCFSVAGLCRLLSASFLDSNHARLTTWQLTCRLLSVCVCSVCFPACLNIVHCGVFVFTDFLLECLIRCYNCPVKISPQTLYFSSLEVPFDSFFKNIFVYLFILFMFSSWILNIRISHF